MSWQTPEGDPPPDPATPPPELPASEPDAETARVPVPEPAIQGPPAEPPAGPDDAQPAAGLISATPVGWTGPDATGVGTGAAATGDPLVAWAPPVAPAAATTFTTDLVISGTFSRVVAYSVDVLLLTSAETIVNGVLGQYGDNPSTSLALIVGIIFIGVDFLYFVGLWTSGWQATIGMRLLKLRVLGARDAATLSLNGALIRWLALTGAIAILSVVPAVRPYVALLSVLWFLALLVSTATDRLHQGLHDRWGSSVVVQPGPGGSGAAFVTCLVLVVFVGIVLPFIALVLAGDQVRDILSQIGASV